MPNKLTTAMTAFAVMAAAAVLAAPVAAGSGTPTGVFRQHCVATGEIALSFEGTDGFDPAGYYVLRSRDKKPFIGMSHPLAGLPGFATTPQMHHAAFIVAEGEFRGTGEILPGVHTIDIFKVNVSDQDSYWGEAAQIRQTGKGEIIYTQTAVKVSKCTDMSASFSGQVLALNGTTPLGGTLLTISSFIYHSKGWLAHTVDYVRPEGPVVSKWSTLTDSKGRFTFSNLSPGSYNVLVNTNGDSDRCYAAYNVAPQVSGEDQLLGLPLASHQRVSNVAVLVTQTNKFDMDCFTPRSKSGLSASPSVLGAAVVGKKLTAEPGSWAKGTALSYQWLADGKKIAKATNVTLKLTDAQWKQKIAVKVTGVKKGEKTVSRTSPTTAKVVRVLTSSKPKVVGEASVGAALEAQPGSWTSGATLSFQWIADGKPIKGATGKKLTVKEPLLEQKLTVKVTGAKKFYETKTVESEAAQVMCRDFLALSIDGTAGHANDMDNTPWRAEQKWEKKVGEDRVQKRGVNYPMLAMGYDSSYKKGVEQVRKAVKRFLESCPKSKIVLFGFSQGADVAATYLASEPINADQLLGAALFGDPRFNPEDKSSFGDNSKYAGAYKTGMWGARTPFPEIYLGKIFSICNQGDQICSSIMTDLSVYYLAGKHKEHAGYADSEYSPLNETVPIDFTAKALSRLANGAPIVYGN